MSIRFDVSNINLYSFRFIIFLFLLYHILYFSMLYDNFFKKLPDYWTKSRKENKRIIKERNKKYTLKEKIKLTIYFILYVFMLIGISFFILQSFNIINLITGIGIILFIVDSGMSFYKLL